MNPYKNQEKATDYHSLDMFSIENHIRDLVKEQLQPLINLHKADADETRRVEAKVDAVQTQVKDVIDVYFQGEGKNDMFDRFYAEITRVERLAVQDNQEIRGSQYSIGTEMVHFKAKAEESTERVTKCEAVLDEVIEGIRNRADQMKTWQEEFVDKIEKRAWQQGDTSVKQLKRIEQMEDKVRDFDSILQTSVKKQKIIKDTQEG